ncbi:MAG: HesB/IscA family protein [bacterium]
MIKLTSEAAQQIQLSCEQSNTKDMPLRVAVMVRDDGSFHYALGFEDAISDEDVRFAENGVEMVVAPASAANLKGMTIDFVELEPGKPQFIFLNPNDPEYVPPVG